MIQITDSGCAAELASAPPPPGSDDVPQQPFSYPACLNFIMQSILRKEWLCSDGYGQAAASRAQEDLWVAHRGLATAPVHPLYERLNGVLEAEGFDRFVEDL